MPWSRRVAQSLLIVLPLVLLRPVSATAQTPPAGPTVRTIDAGPEVGHYASLVIGSDGLPLIAYYDQSNRDLTVAHCEDVTCASATITTLDSAGDVGAHASAVLGTDGLALIAYDGTNGTVKVAHCNDVACTGATLSTLNTGGAGASVGSLAMGADGRGIISYSEIGRLKTAHCSDVPCTTADLREVAAFNLVGDSAIGIGAEGLPLVAYVAYSWPSGNSNELRVVRCNDAACTSATSHTIASVPSGTGMISIRDVALARGADDLGLITANEGGFTL